MPFDNKNSGTLGRNEKMREGKRDPEFNGKINTVCPHCHKPADFWLNAWQKITDGRRWLSLSARPKDGQGSPEGAPASDNGFFDE